MTSLLDVNALIALVDQDHVGHTRMQNWFSEQQSAGWATCPLTENGMVRVLSQPSYASGQRTPLEAVTVLRALKEAFAASYEFWPDSVSLSDASLFRPELIAGPRQVTDAYLLGLAAQRKGRLVSFNGGLAWQGVAGGSTKLIAHP